MVQTEIIGSEKMTVSEMINRAMEIKGVRKKDIAAQMGWSPQNFNGRLKNGTIDAEEWVKISKLLGYEIQMVDAVSNQVVKQRKPGTGPRVIQMVEGYLYDTEKADSLCHTPKVFGGWFELFKDVTTGKYFTVAYLETGESACVAVISPERAKQFYLDCGGEQCSEYFAE